MTAHTNTTRTVKQMVKIAEFQESEVKWSNKKIYIGLDPGLSGGVCSIVTEEQEIPGGGVFTRKKYFWRKFDGSYPQEAIQSMYNAILLAKWAGDEEDYRTPVKRYAVLENVSAMPGQGVASTFKFGTAFGAARMALESLGIPTRLVRPTVWQRRVGIDKVEGESHVDKKNRHKALAEEYVVTHWKSDPTMKITHAVADAILLAEYCHSLASADGMTSYEWINRE